MDNKSGRGSGTLERGGRAVRIGKLAETMGLKPSTLRYYEREGLLAAPRRTAAGYRDYGPEDQAVLRFVRQAQEVGLTLEEIGTVLQLRRGGACPCGYVAKLLEQKTAAVERKIRELEDFLRELSALRERAARGIQDTGRYCEIIEERGP
jgi:DNA-binding transcriptional MerR regulator